jgi:hypothetical protein
LFPVTDELNTQTKGQTKFKIKKIFKIPHIAAGILLSEWASDTYPNIGSVYIQHDSKRWTPFHMSIFPELYMVCE